MSKYAHEPLEISQGLKTVSHRKRAAAKCASQHFAKPYRAAAASRRWLDSLPAIFWRRFVPRSVVDALVAARARAKNA